MRTLLTMLNEHLRPTKEPVGFVVAGIAVAFIGYQVIVEGKAPAEVLDENYIEGVFLTVSGILTRLSVFSPKTVKDNMVDARSVYEMKAQGQHASDTEE